MSECGYRLSKIQLHLALEDIVVSKVIVPVDQKMSTDQIECCMIIEPLSNGEPRELKDEH